MGQETPELFLRLLDNFPESRRYPAACDLPSGSVPTEVFGNEPPPAEASTGSASAEVVDVEVELNTLNKIEFQAVRIITENLWHLFQSGILTLRDNQGESVLNPFGEPILCVREYYRLSTSQQEELRSQGINRLVWERMPLTGHSIMFCMRAWEVGRMTADVKNYSSDQERDVYNQKLAYYENVGWLRDIPEPFKPRPDDTNPTSLERERIEADEDMRDKGELRIWVCSLRPLKICILALFQITWGKHQHFGKDLHKGCHQEKCIWLILILALQLLQFPLRKISALISTTTCSFQQDFATGHWKGSWKKHMRTLFLVVLLNMFFVNSNSTLRAEKKFRTTSTSTWWLTLRQEHLKTQIMWTLLGQRSS